MGRKLKGSIIQRGPNSFEAWVRTEQLGTRPTREEAQEVIDQWLRTENPKASHAFETFGGAWILEREKQNRVRGIRQERSAWDHHIAKAHWYPWPIKEILPEVLQTWLGELLETCCVQTIRTREGIVRRETDEPLSRKTIANIIGLLARCFDYAIVKGKCKTNPARALILPPAEVDEEEGDESSQLITHFTPDEIAALFKLDLPVRTRAIFAVALYVGTSKGELWGLRWQDITFDARDPFVRIRKSYERTLKSKRRRRDVPLLRPAREALLEWRASLPTAPLVGLVFPSEGGSKGERAGGCHNPSYDAGWRDQPMRRKTKANPEGVLTVRKGWRSKAGIREAASGLHVFRHSTGTHLLQGTWAPLYHPRALTMQEVSKWLGHSSVTVTERHYAEFTSGALRNVVRFAEAASEDEAAEGE